MSMLRSGVQALKWSLLGELGARVVAPLAFIVLARILVPEDFGVVAAATVLLSLAQVVCELGLAKALVQREGRIDEAADTAFWLNLGVGLVLMGGLFAGAPLAARFFAEPRIAAVLQVLAPTMPVAAAAAVPMALMQRRLAFRALFWVRLAGSALPALASVPAALAGAGVWALVAGAAATPLVQAAMAGWLGQWRPRRRFDRALAAELLRFGRWALLAALLGWGYGWLDAIVVGHALGAQEMGLYRTGNTFVTMVFGTLFAPLMPVVYSLFSRAQHDLPRLREAMMTAVRAIALVSLPLALALWVGRDEIAATVLGPAWRDAGLVIGVMALAQGASWLVSLNGELYRAVGKPHAEALATGPMLAVYLAVYLWAVQGGLERFLWARLALVGVALAVHVWVCRRVVQLPLARWARAAMAVAAAFALVALIGRWPVAAAAPAVLVFTVALAASEWPLLRRLAGGLR